MSISRQTGSSTTTRCDALIAKKSFHCIWSSPNSSFLCFLGLDQPFTFVHVVSFVISSFLPGVSYEDIKPRAFVYSPLSIRLLVVTFSRTVTLSHAATSSISLIALLFNCRLLSSLIYLGISLLSLVGLLGVALGKFQLTTTPRLFVSGLLTLRISWGPIRTRTRS